MPTIEINPISKQEDADVFLVKVQEDGSQTEHRVTVSAEELQKYGHGNADAEELVRASFEFLLQHESKEDILKEFNIGKIGYYFKEYSQVMMDTFS